MRKHPLQKFEFQIYLIPQNQIFVWINSGALNFRKECTIASEYPTDGRINPVYTGQEQRRAFFEDSNNGYFVRYHNNIPLLAIFAVYYKILSTFGLCAADMMSNYMSVLLNIVFIMLTVIFGMFTVRNLFGTKGMMAYLIISALFAPYYINACRLCTDTMSMPFVTGTLWIYSMDDNKFKWSYLRYIFMGVLLGIGSLIKGSIIIIVVAIFL